MSQSSGTSQQHKNEQSAVPAGETPVAGRNPAFYYSAPSSEQLFDVSELTFEPNPPVPDRRFFAYLKGDLPKGLDNLDEATLTLTLSINGGEEQDDTKRFVDWVSIANRANYEWGHGLRPGRNELITDFYAPAEFLRSGRHSIKLEAKLPDDRLLFCFKMNLDWKGQAD